MFRVRVEQLGSKLGRRFEKVLGDKAEKVREWVRAT